MSKFRFNQLANSFKAALPGLLDRMANNAVNHFKIVNFDSQAFVDDAPQRWAPRKSKRDNAGRRLLVKTGRMRESIKVLSSIGNTRKIGTLVPYSKYHNDGVPGRLPKRQFIGNSRRLERKNAKLIQDYLRRYTR